MQDTEFEAAKTVRRMPNRPNHCVTAPLHVWSLGGLFSGPHVFPPVATTRNSAMTSKIAIQINPNDNVVTVVEDASSGDDVQYMTPEGPRRVALVEAVPMGHKVAICDISLGQPVLKYDQPIGAASKLIQKGRHVHDHNVKSAVQGVTDED